MNVGQWLSLSDLHEITGVDRATIRKKLAGIEPRIGEKNAKLYDKKVALTAILATTAAIDEVNAKERRAAAEAEKAELVVRKLRGELVPVSAMQQSAAELIKTLYTRTVRVLPGVVAPMLLSKNAVDIETILRKELSDVFNELKTLPESFLTITDDEEVIAEDDSTEDGD